MRSLLPAAPPAAAASCTDDRTGASFEAAPGRSLLDAALEQGVDLPHGCRSGTCGACAVEILEGTENLVAPDPIEADSLERFRMRDCERLACRACATGPVRLRPLD